MRAVPIAFVLLTLLEGEPSNKGRINPMSRRCSRCNRRYVKQSPAPPTRPAFPAPQDGS